MDLIFLAAGGVVIAFSTVFTAIGRSVEMQKLVTKPELASGIAPGSRWEDCGAIGNMVGALAVAYGAILSGTSTATASLIWGIALAVILIILTVVTLFRRRLMGLRFFQRKIG